MSLNQGPALRRHGLTEPALGQLPQPTHAERLRTLLSLSSMGTLSTLSRKHPGYPFGSLAPYALDPLGRPIFLISKMAMHTQNLQSDPRASLFVEQSASEGDPLGSARCSLVGDVKAITEAEAPAAREQYLSRHENSRYWVDFADFVFFHLEPLELYYIGGFGVMGWVDPQTYREASPDPLAETAPGILAHMNADHTDSMILLARANAGLEATEATMTMVDRLGFYLRLKTASGMKSARINFLREVATPEDARKVLVQMVGQARMA